MESVDSLGVLWCRIVIRSDLVGLLLSIQVLNGEGGVLNSVLISSYNTTKVWMSKELALSHWHSRLFQNNFKILQMQTGELKSVGWRLTLLWCYRKWHCPNQE